MEDNRMNTPQYSQGARWGDFLFNLFKRRGARIFQQDNRWMLSNELKDIIKSNSVIELLEAFYFDFLLIKKEQIYIVKVKSKSLKQNKEDRKIDTSHKQVEAFEKCEDSEIEVIIMVVWHYKEGEDEYYYYKGFSFSRLERYEGKKVKFKLPASLDYSPERVNYKKRTN